MARGHVESVVWVSEFELTKCAYRSQRESAEIGSFSCEPAFLQRLAHGRREPRHHARGPRRC